jgi:thiamine monophosphate synthase
LIAIGGIKLDNVAEAISAGADGIAVVSGLMAASDVQARAGALLHEIALARGRFEYELEEAL